MIFYDFKNIKWLYNCKLSIKIYAFLCIVLSFKMTGCYRKGHKKDITETQIQSLTTTTAKTPYKGQIYYNTYFRPEKEWKVVSERNKTTNHLIFIQGLRPGTRYLYTTDHPQNPKKHEFFFKTKPLPSMPFRFSIIPAKNQTSKSLSTQIEKHLIEGSEFIVLSLTEELKPDKSYVISKFLSYIPIFILSENSAPFEIEWGSLHIFSYSYSAGKKEQEIVNWIKNKLKSSSSPNNIVITNDLTLLLSANAKKIKTLFADYGVDSIFIISEREFERTTISQIPTIILSDRRENIPVVLNVDYYELTAEIIDKNNQKKELVLKTPTIAMKRTCDYCRQLSEQGKYKESIDAYKEFIQENESSYQVDDAQFEIAEIYDRKLYDYKNALIEYQKFLDKYPSSPKYPIVEERIGYIKEYSDFDFMPLSDFERLKSEFFIYQSQQNLQLKAIQSAEKTLIKYPNCKLSEEIIFWLANTYKPINYNKSIQYFKNLILSAKNEILRQDAFFGIIDVLYEKGKYKEVIKFVKKHEQKVNDEIRFDVQKKIAMCKRNIRRRRLNFISLCELAIFIMLSIFLHQKGFIIKEFKLLLNSFILFMLLQSILLVPYWNYVKSLFVFALLVAVFIPLISFLAFNLSLKLSKRFSLIIGSFLAVIQTIFFFYALIYNYYVHYLVLFKL